MPTIRHPGRFRVGFIGAGGISSSHASALRMVDDAELVAVCDTVPGRAETLARKFGIQQVFSGADQMLRDARLDAVHILTTPQYHADLAVRCLQAGSHIFVEKPFATSVADCERVQAEASRSGLVCGVNHSLTQIPIMDRIVAEIRSRRLGRVNHVIVDFSAPPQDVPIANPSNYMFESPTNVLFEYGAHPFSVIRLLMGKLVKAECFVTSERQLAANRRFFDAWHVAMICERGTANLHLSVGREARSLGVRVLGEDGIALAELSQGTLRFIENSPYEFTGPLRSAIGDGRMAIGAAISGIRDQIEIAVGKPSRRSSAFVRGQMAFYQALRSGDRPREDASAAKDVVQYCEQTARNAKFALAPSEAR